VDTLIHPITGGVIARAINDERIGPWGTIAGLAMGAFRDSDFILGLFNRHFYLQYQRDLTHSLLLIPFYALFFGWVFTKVSRRPHCVPLQFLQGPHNPCHQWIQVSIPNEFQQVWLLFTHDRLVPILKQMAMPSALQIVANGIAG